MDTKVPFLIIPTVIVEVVVHRTHYYTQVSEGNDGKPITEKGRWTDILMKKDGKWIMIGDHGGEIKSGE